MSNIGHNKQSVNVAALSPEDRKKIKNTIMELNDSMTRVAAERDFQKDAVNSLHDSLGVDKKLIKRMAKVYFKANYNEEVEENNSFEEYYNQIVKSV